MSDYTMIQVWCEQVLRDIERGDSKATEVGLYELYEKLYNHFHYVPPPLGISVKEEIKAAEKVG